MGYLGAALAVSVSNGVQLSGLIVCCVVGKVRPPRAARAPAPRPAARRQLLKRRGRAAQVHRRTWVPWSRACLRGWVQFLALAVPSMLMMFEWIASEVRARPPRACCAARPAAGARRTSWRRARRWPSCWRACCQTRSAPCRPWQSTRCAPMRAVARRRPRGRPRACLSGSVVRRAEQQRARLHGAAGPGDRRHHAVRARSRPARHARQPGRAAQARAPRRVSNDLGAGDPGAAARAARVAAALSVCTMLVLAVPAVLLRRGCHPPPPPAGAPRTGWRRARGCPERMRGQREHAGRFGA